MPDGRNYISLDPTGYDRLAEPGFHWRITGDRLFGYLQRDSEDVHQDNGFYQPEGTPWLMTRPLQWGAEWHLNPYVARYTLPTTSWKWATGVERLDYRAAEVCGGSPYAAYTWMNVTTIPAGVVSLLDVDFDAISEAAAVTLPDGMAVIASAYQTPPDVNGTQWPFSTYSFTPYIEAGVFRTDPKASVQVYGFGDLALVITYDRVTCLQRRATEIGTVQWRTIRQIYATTESKRGSYGQPNDARSVGMVVQAVTVVPVLPDWLFIHVGGKHTAVRMRTSYGSAGDLNQSGRAENVFAPGVWWMAGVPSTHHFCHVEIVGYGLAEYPAHEGDPPVRMFSLGASYKPASGQDPDSNHMGIFNEPEGITHTETAIASGVESSTSQGQVVRHQILDHTGQPWVSNGDNYYGGLHVRLYPSTSTYLPTQLHSIEMKFPVLRTARTAGGASLDDSIYATWKASASYTEPLGKRVSVSFWQTLTDVIDVGGFGRRHYYPVHIDEDVTTTDGEGNETTTRTKRIAGWVMTPQLEEHQVDVGEGRFVRFYPLEGAGLLKRGDRKPERLPQIVNPDRAGYITHLDAVRAALEAVGFDCDDADQVYLHPDKLETSDVGRLPGTWAQYNPEVGQSTDCPWAPDWDEALVAYAVRIGQEWRGWRLYEDLSGKVWYHPDLLFYVRLGGAYWSSCTLYPSHATATAAGAPGMCYQVMPRREVRTQGANTVIVMGPGTSDKAVPQVVDRLPYTITDLGSRDFVGEPVVDQIVSKLAITQEAKRQIARMRLYQVGHAAEEATVAVQGPAPWRWLPNPVDVGHVVTLSQFGGVASQPFLVAGIDVEQIASKRGTQDAVHRTVLTLMRLPDSAVASATQGAFPGQGAEA